jgi:FKBP-type peptidyl-prolyl cis-trans isomerase SlyD
MLIGRHKVVTLEYVLKDESGQVLEQTEGEPFIYIHGMEQVIPGLERHLEGQESGAKLRFTVSPEEAFGEHDPAGIFTVPREVFPQDKSIDPGDILMGEDDEGEMMPVRVVEVLGEEVRVDANHPLAGMTLCYEVTVRDVREATAEEISEGQAAGAEEPLIHMP